jgi:arylsulfatase A-like enzyme
MGCRSAYTRFCRSGQSRLQAQRIDRFESFVYLQRARPQWPSNDAQNILIVLIDDAGPGLATTCGADVRTDTRIRIHDEGVGFNRFHMTAMYSPNRASLLTGRNHHRIGQGQIAEPANDWDAYAGEIPESSSPAAEVLDDYGYGYGYGYATDTAAVDASKQCGNGHRRVWRTTSSTCAGGQ